MKHVLFICEGNVCRSPSAEAYFNYRIAQEGLKDSYFATSKGLIFSTMGQDIHHSMVEMVDRDGIPHPKHSAKMATRQDIAESDYVLVMVADQKVQLKRNLYLSDMSKVARLGDYLSPEQDIEDPYFTGRWEYSYSLIKQAVDAFIDYLKNN